MTDLRLRSQRVLLDGSWQEADLAISENRIEAIELPGAIADSLDLGDLRVVPGLIDIQVNGGYGRDFTADPSAMWDVGMRLVETGVTAFLPTQVTAPEGAVDAMLAALSRRPAGYSGAEPLGIHIEGPMLAAQKPGAHEVGLLRSEVAMDRWRPPAVRVVTLASEVAGSDTVRELSQRGVVVALGHTAAGYDDASAAFAMGATHVTHLFNAMTPLDHREPGLIGAAMTTPHVFASVIADGIHVHPAVLRIAARQFDGRLVAMTDAIAAAGMPPGTYQVGPKSIESDGRRAVLADGTLAGSILTMDTAVRNLIEMAGLSPVAAFSAASRAPAQLIGDSRRGRIEVGSRADLVVMDSDWSVVSTILGGSVVHGASLWD